MAGLPSLHINEFFRPVTETETKIRQIIVDAMRLETPAQDLKGQDLEAELGLTSVDALEILIRTEIEFGIRIADEDLSGDLVRSISALETYVGAKLQGT